MNLTPEDIEALARTLAPMIAERLPHPCPFTTEHVTELQGMARRAVTIKAAITSRITDALVYGVIALIMIGVVQWIRERVGQ